MDKLDILFTIDKKYRDMMLACAISFILNGNIDELRLHIVTSDFELEDYNKVEEILYKYPGVELYFYDIKSLEIEKFNIPNWRGTQIANARLFFQEILNEKLSNIDNLLYLDSDMIVVSDISDLDKYKDNLVNAVKDGCINKYLETFDLNNYFNSGLILFNVSEWTKGNYQDKLIHFIENCKLELTYPDQDIINCALDGKISEIPLNYNLGTNCYLFNDFLLKFYYKNRNISHSEVENAKIDPKILHSTGLLGIKPWMENNINPFNEEFMKYIYMANSEFEKIEISTLKKILTASPLLFKTMLLSKEVLPEKVSKLTRKLM